MNRTVKRCAVGIAVVATVLGTATAANAAGNSIAGRPKLGFTVGVTNPVPGLNQGESARFVVRDDGRSLAIDGFGRGFKDGSYASLIYADKACSVPVNPSGDTVDGIWQNTGNSNRNVHSVYTGNDYRALKGKVGSVSIRKVLSAANTGGGNFTIVAQARACAPLTPLGLGK